MCFAIQENILRYENWVRENFIERFSESLEKRVLVLKVATEQWNMRNRDRKIEGRWATA